MELFICLFDGRSFSVFEGSCENGVTVIIIEDHHIFVAFIRVNWESSCLIRVNLSRWYVDDTNGGIYKVCAMIRCFHYGKVIVIFCRWLFGGLDVFALLVKMTFCRCRAVAKEFLNDGVID